MRKAPFLQIWEKLSVRIFMNSFGVGARLLLNTVIVRVDQGFSEEGAETTIYSGYPF